MKKKYYFNHLFFEKTPLLHNCNTTVTEMRLRLILNFYKVSLRKFKLDILLITIYIKHCLLFGGIIT